MPLDVAALPRLYEPSQIWKEMSVSAVALEGRPYTEATSLPAHPNTTRQTFA